MHIIYCIICIKYVYTKIIYTYYIVYTYVYYSTSLNMLRDIYFIVIQYINIYIYILNIILYLIIIHYTVY